MSSISPIHPKRESALPSQPRKMGGGRLYSFPEGNSHKTTLSSQRVFHERRNNRAHSLSASSASSRKQKHPQPVQEKQAAIEDDDDHMSNFSDSDEDDNSHFIYKSQARHIETGITRKCDWCDRLSTQCELTLVTHDRVNKNFCTEDCQDLFKENLLSRKVCEWCKKSCPTELTMIVVEPSTESVPLQFCAQSCVNKYKMEVFCEEVKEQLRRIKEGNIQIPNVSKPNHKERKILITPELWSEGESAMVFVNDSPAHSSNCEPQNRLADPLTSQGVDISERKRKGSSMETVISKLSRRQHRYTIKPATDSMTHYCADIPDRQTTPINLSVHKPPSTALPVRVDNSNTEPTSGAHQSQTTPAAKISSEQCKPWNGSLFMPLPILIPIPIPIPIPMNKYAEALAAAAIKKDSSTAAPVSQRKDSVTNEQISVPVNPLGPKRYVLKRPLTSDDPE